MVWRRTSSSRICSGRCSRSRSASSCTSAIRIPALPAGPSSSASGCSGRCRLSTNTPAICSSSALMSVELLAFTSLFGAYFYGGVSSPFLPWLLVSLLLGFFYLSERPILVVGLFTFNIAGFVDCLPGLRLSRSALPRAAFDGRLDLDPLGDHLHVLDGDLLRQHDFDAIGPRARGRAASRDGDPAARSQGYGRRGQPGEVDLPRQDEPRAAHAAERGDRFQRDPA